MPNEKKSVVKIFLFFNQIRLETVATDESYNIFRTYVGRKTAKSVSILKNEIVELCNSREVIFYYKESRKFLQTKYGIYDLVKIPKCYRPEDGSLGLFFKN